MAITVAIAAAIAAALVVTFKPKGDACSTSGSNVSIKFEQGALTPGYIRRNRSLECNWPKEAMNRPIGAGVVHVLTFYLIVNSGNE